MGPDVNETPCWDFSDQVINLYHCLKDRRWGENDAYGEYLSIDMCVKSSPWPYLIFVIYLTPAPFSALKFDTKNA